MLEILLLVALVILIIGSITDIRIREVPDWINFSGIFLGIGLRMFFTAYNFEWSWLIDGLIGFGVAFILAQLMYRLGQWGGGDSKMIMALGALLGVQFRVDYIMTSFIVNLLVVGALYGICWSLYLAVKHKKEVFKRLKKIWLRTTRHRITGYVIFIVLVILGVFLDYPVNVIALIVAFSTILIIFLGIFMKGVEDVSFLKKVSVRKLTEGDWIAKAVKVKDKLICGPKDLGIGMDQIKRLKRFKIKTVWIKEGIPFIPSFLLAFLASVFIGNIIFKVIQLSF